MTLEPAESQPIAGDTPPQGTAGRAPYKPLAPLVENVAESATACLLTMVQGNLLALTVSHWLIASRTGLVSGTIATAALWLLGSRRRWMVALLLGGVTFAADYWTHPSHFGGAAAEAVVTGVAAGALSALVGKLIGWRRKRAALLAR